MRVASFHVHNYKGLARVELDELSDEPVVTLSGRNGTGKSLILEALLSTWNRRILRAENVGPWANDMRTELTLDFTEDEWKVIDEWHITSFGQAAPRDTTIIYQQNRGGVNAKSLYPACFNTVHNVEFMKQNQFGTIDLLAARRSLSSASGANVDLGMMSNDRVMQERSQLLDQYLTSRVPMSLPDISTYLMTLDYQNFVATRQGLPVSDEFERMASLFINATGKELLEPTYSPGSAAKISIRLPSGHEHAISELSSGEQELLSMAYFVRRLSGSGGVLCLDEPEQHLHPTLQAALLDSMRDLADRAQVWLISHAGNLIASAPLSGLKEVDPPVNTLTNQLVSIADDTERADVLATLGVSPTAFIQADAILVVEGESDALWLPAMFPVELGRVHLIVAGSASQVMQMNRALQKLPVDTPWMTLRDRDMLTDDEVQTLKSDHPNLYVWPRRAIESMLLDADLLSAVLSATGAEYTAEAVLILLRALADDLREDVLAALVDAALQRAHPGPAAPTGGGRFDKMKQQLVDLAEVNASRAADLEDELAAQRTTLNDSWDEKWLTLADPKALLGKIQAETGVFKSVQILTRALATRARTDPAVRPQGLEEFRVSLVALLG